jgi:hypothetical protein
MDIDMDIIDMDILPIDIFIDIWRYRSVRSLCRCWELPRGVDWRYPTRAMVSSSTSPARSMYFALIFEFGLMAALDDDSSVE